VVEIPPQILFLLYLLNTYLLNLAADWLRRSCLLTTMSSFVSFRLGSIRPYI